MKKETLIRYLTKKGYELTDLKEYDGSSYYEVYTKDNLACCVDYYRNGNLWFIHNYKDGKPDGVQKWWHENGKRWYIQNFKNNKLDGVQKSWYDNGKKECILSFKNGKKEGEQKKWNKEGDLVKHQLVKDYLNN